MLVSAVHPVAVLSAVFWMVCSFCRFVVDVIGDQMVLPYSSVGRVMVCMWLLGSLCFCPIWLL